MSVPLSSAQNSISYVFFGYDCELPPLSSIPIFEVMICSLSEYTKEASVFGSLTMSLVDSIDIIGSGVKYKENCLNRLATEYDSE